MSDKHDMTWEDERLAGVSCWVKTEPWTHPHTGEVTQLPTEGGTAAAGEVRPCASCGQLLRLDWNVDLVDVPTEDRGEPR